MNEATDDRSLADILVPHENNLRFLQVLLVRGVADLLLLPTHVGLNVYILYNIDRVSVGFEND